MKNRIAVLEGFERRRGRHARRPPPYYIRQARASRRRRSARARFDGALDGILDTSVKPIDVGVGALLAIAGLAGLKWILGRPSIAPKVPALVMRFQPALAGGLAAAALYLTQRGGDQKRQERGVGHAVGALMAGVAFNLLNEAKGAFPTFFADLIDLRLAGTIINDAAVRAQLPQLTGVIVDEVPSGPGGLGGDLGDLAADPGDGDDETSLYDAP